MGTKKVASKKELSNAETLKLANDVAVAKLVESSGQFKVEMNATLDKIVNQVIDRKNELGEIDKAIEIQKKLLKDIYDVDYQADSLAQLKQTAEETVRANKEAEEQVKLERKRNEEQYQYDQKILRQKRKDELEAELKELRLKQDETFAAKYKDLETRQNAVADAENKIKLLEEHILKLGEEHKSDKSAAVSIATNSLKKELTHTHELEKLKLNSELELQKSINANLSSEVAALKAQIKDLDMKYQQETSKFQQIAEKAIDSSSKSSVIVQTNGQEELKANKR